jgi:hypothetical protein
MHEASAMRDPLLGFHLAHRDSRVWSARHGWTPMERIFPNRDDVNVTVKLEARTAPVGTEVPVSLIAAGPNGANGWGTVNVDFGDGKPLAHTAFVGAAGLRHVYSERGEYDVSVTISMPSAPSIVRTDRVKILAGELIAPYSAEWIGGLPPDAMRRPISVTIDRVTIGESRIELHGSRTSSLWETARAEFWVWLIGHEGGNLRAHLYHARPEPDANGDARRGDTFTLAIAPDVRPDGPLASVMVGVSSVRGKPVDSRSGLFSFDWPAPPLTIGAPIVVTAAEAR